jgi:ribosomal protein L44E
MTLKNNVVEIHFCDNCKKETEHKVLNIAKVCSVCLIAKPLREVKKNNKKTNSLR